MNQIESLSDDLKNGFIAPIHAWAYNKRFFRRNFIETPENQCRRLIARYYTVFDIAEVAMPDMPRICARINWGLDT